MKNETNTVPFPTAIPNSAIKPITADTLKVTFKINTARIPPTKAKGRFNITNAAAFNEPKAENSMIKIRKITTGTTIDYLRIALCWFSNCPPPSMKYPDGNDFSTA